MDAKGGSEQKITKLVAAVAKGRTIHVSLYFDPKLDPDRVAYHRYLVGMAGLALPSYLWLAARHTQSTIT